MKVGAILFDSANNLLNAGSAATLGSGWASISGHAPTRVQSVHDLSGDTLWLTNLTYTDLRRTGLHSHPNFRAESWLKSPVQQLIAELGIDCDRNPVDTAATVIATIAQRVADLSTKNYGITLRSQSLNTDFAEALEIRSADSLQDIQPIIETIASHPSVSVIRMNAGEGEAGSVILRRNRLEHAQSVLNILAPEEGVWQQEKTSARDGSDHWLEDVTTPFLVQCAISNVSPAVAEILSWGSGSSAPRDWLTDIEWRVVRQYSDIRIGSVFIHSHPGATPHQSHLLPRGPHAALSLTNGLVAEQIWSCLTLKRPVGGQKSCFSAVAAWIRSADRMGMFEYATELHSQGLDVMRYGNGNVVVAYKEGELSKVMDIATDIALMPPANKFIEATCGASGL